MTTEHADLVRRLDGWLANDPEVLDTPSKLIREAVTVLAQQAAELALRRKSGSATERLHNLCEGIAADADGSEWSREEWERIDAENLRLRNEIAQQAAELERLRAGEPAGEVVGLHKVGFAEMTTVAWSKVPPPIGTKLYTAPPLSAAPAVEVLDAKRYRWLKDVSLRYSNRLQAVEVHEFISPIAYGPNIDEAIDAAIAATQQRSAEPPQAPTADLVERVAAALYEASCEVGQREHLVPHAERFQTLARAAIAATKEKPR
jgi:hypothetical protein